MNLRLPGAFSLLILSSLLMLGSSCSTNNQPATKDDATAPGVAILLIDTDHPEGSIDQKIYGHFLEHINHSVVDGLYADQVRGQGFEQADFTSHWEASGQKDKVTVVEIPFEKGVKSVRLSPANGEAGIKQDSIYVQRGVEYNGSVWVKPETGRPPLVIQLRDSANQVIATSALPYSSNDWQEVNFSFTPTQTALEAMLEITATGTGSVLIDFISMMTASARANGKFRPDLLQAVKDLKPPFIRWPGGSFASTYKWKDGIGTPVSRVYHPNIIWGGYADYYGFGTDEFLEMCRQLDTEPLIVLPAMSADTAALEYAMNWVHYLIDPPSTEWGRMRAANGHAEPYKIPWFQIDNEPMNNNFSADQYAAIVNLYGSRLRKIAPGSKIIACGQKRSNDLNWSQKVIDIAGANFDILGCHNYEYEPENFQTGIQRISDYLVRLDRFIQQSRYPNITIGILEWNLCRAYDWRAGLHAAGNLIAYERLSPRVNMTCPALLMRNTTDNPEWRSFIYHDHSSWFPGAGYVVEKLFRDHYAEVQLASAAGTFRDRPDRATFFNDIPQMKPEDWTAGTIDAIATQSRDGQRIIIKAVNYAGTGHTLLTRLQGAAISGNARIKTYTIRAGLTDSASIKRPDAIKVEEGTMNFDKNLSFEMAPYSVLVAEVEKL